MSPNTSAPPVTSSIGPSAHFLIVLPRSVTNCLIQANDSHAYGLEHCLRLGIGQEPAVFAEGLERTARCFADLRAAGVAPRAVQVEMVGEAAAAR